MSTAARELTVVQPGLAVRSPEWHAAARRHACCPGSRSPGWVPRERSPSRPASLPTRSPCSSFGLDSAIEGFAASSSSGASPARGCSLTQAEERAQKLVAIQFFLLAPYVAFEAVHKARHRRAATDELGRDRPRHHEPDRDALPWPRQAAASLTSLALSPLAAKARRTSSAPTSPPPSSSASSATHFSGFWWLDPVAALVVAAGCDQGGTRELARRRLLRQLLGHDRAPSPDQLTRAKPDA